MKCAIQWVSSFHKRFPRIGQVFSCCVVLINVVFFNTNCDLRRIGPPISSLFAEEYLQKQGYERHVIDAILEYKKIDHETVLKMSKITEPAVRDMLGQNSYLTREERNIFWQDKDDFVRGGVAMNPSITREEILIALGKEKKSSRVFAGLARNPFVPEDILMDLRYKSHVSLSSFACNLNCPDVIAKEIEEAGTNQDKELLKVSRDLKREGYYLGRSLPVSVGAGP